MYICATPQIVVSGRYAVAHVAAMQCAWVHAS
jgi:hypothetical protein